MQRLEAVNDIEYAVYQRLPFAIAKVSQSYSAT
jgi:hypothetical protein